MKMNFRKIGFILSMVAMTSFAMTSCAEGEEEVTTEAEGDAHGKTEEVKPEETPEVVTPEVETPVVNDSTATETCGAGDATETCGGGDAEEPAAH